MVFTKKELRAQVKSDSLPHALKETHKEAKRTMRFMALDILKSHKEHLRKGA